MSRWVDQTITTFDVCTRLDQAGSDWERTACLCLRAKGNLLLLRSKRHDEKKEMPWGKQGQADIS